MQWYYAVGDQRIGPVSAEQFAALVSDGAIRADTLVWKSGMANWEPYASVQGLPTPATPTPASVVVAPTVASVAVTPAAEPRASLPSRTSAPQAVGANYAGFWIRFVAKIIDAVILWVVSLVINGGLTSVFFRASRFTMGSGADMGKIMLIANLTTLLSLAEGIAFTWFFLSRFDATPGKMALGLKVLRPDGSKLSTGRIFGRYFAEILSCLIFLIGYIIAAFDDQKRALHDHLCETRVFKTK